MRRIAAPASHIGNDIPADAVLEPNMFPSAGHLLLHPQAPLTARLFLRSALLPESLLLWQAEPRFIIYGAFQFKAFHELSDYMLTFGVAAAPAA